jgi:hypothetical protein
MPRAKRNRTAVKTVCGWFEEQLEAKALPDDIAQIVETMKVLGFAPSIEDADKIVAYYKAARKIPLKNLIPEWELRGYGSSDLREEVTLDEFEKVRARVEKARKERLAHFEEERLARLVREEQECRENWEPGRAEVVAALEKVKGISERIKLELPLAAEFIASKFEELEKIVHDLPLQYPNERFITLEGRGYASKTVMSSLEERMALFAAKWKKWLDAPSCEVVIFPGYPVYVLRKEGDRWQRVRAQFFESKLPQVPAVLTVKDLGASLGWNKEKLCENFVAAKEVATDPRHFPTVVIATPSRKHEGAFVGFLNGKVALPNWLIIEPGKYLCFVMGETEKYYRVWTIQKVE